MYACVAWVIPSSSRSASELLLGGRKKSCETLSKEMPITILTVCRDCRVHQCGSIGPFWYVFLFIYYYFNSFLCEFMVFIYLFVFIRKIFSFSVKYLAVYKYSSHIKSFSNIELGPQFCVVGESVRLSGPWYWRCNIFIVYYHLWTCCCYLNIGVSFCKKFLYGHTM